MALYKLSIVVAFTTRPFSASVARAHSGSFSEQLWTNSGPLTSIDFMPVVNKRAALLPVGSTIIGFRQQAYTIVGGNKLRPGGSSSAPLNIPGAMGTLGNPQSCFGLGLKGSGVSNVGRYNMRATPDENVKNGEFDYNGFQMTYTTFFNELVTGPYGFVGRNRAAVTIEVLGYNGTNMVIGNPASVPVGTQWRFLHVVKASGAPIEGVYTVKTVDLATGAITWQPTVDPNVRAQGYIRLDQISFIKTAQVFPGRIGVKKVGRPTEPYVGRRSKSPA